MESNIVLGSAQVADYGAINSNSGQQATTIKATNKEQIMESALAPNDAFTDREFPAAVSESRLEPSSEMDASQRAKLSPNKAHDLSLLAEKILKGLVEVQQQMISLELYISTQKDEDKPLYQWDKYYGYRALHLAVISLDTAAAQFEPVYLPKEYVRSCIRRARQSSTSVSNAAVYAMGVMSEKTAMCIDEIEESGMTSEAKANASIVITNELKKLLKHCARATARVYATLDLLGNSLRINEIDRRDEISLIAGYIERHKRLARLSRKKWLWIATVLILAATTSILFGLMAAPSQDAGRLQTKLAADRITDGIYTHVMNLVHRTHATTNLTGELYSMKLQDIDQRYKALEAATESHGSRIDNLIEALGPTNDAGLYFFPTKVDGNVPKNIHISTSDISKNADRRLEQLRNDLVNLRKNINRMDIRLTGRLNKVDR